MASLVTALDHLQLTVARLDEAVAWYTDVLGFRLLTNYGAYAMLRLEPGLDVMLWEAADHAPVQVAVDGETKPIFFLKTESFDQLAARLEQEQVRVAGIEDLGFARFVKFYDPSDNFLGAIEFAQDPSAA